MNSIPVKQIDGDLNVSRNGAFGGNAIIRGNAHVCHDLIIDGWLEVDNLKAQMDMGIYDCEEDLLAAYPNPKPGWWALVGENAETLYYVKNGVWENMNVSYDETVAYKYLNASIIRLRDEVNSRFQMILNESNSDAIDTLNEILEFLNGIKDTEELATILQDIASQIQEAKSEAQSAQETANTALVGNSSVSEDLKNYKNTITNSLDTLNQLINKKVTAEDGKGLSTNDFSDEEKAKLQQIEANANNYVHPDTHPASMISEDETHRFLTDEEKAKLQQIEANANNYVHPDTHPASMISEDETHRFLTDEEKAKLQQIMARKGEVVILPIDGTLNVGQMPPDNGVYFQLRTGRQGVFTGDFAKYGYNIKDYNLEGGSENKMFYADPDNIYKLGTALYALNSDSTKLIRWLTEDDLLKTISYTHPATHPAEMIIQDESHQFVSAQEHSSIIIGLPFDGIFEGNYNPEDDYSANDVLFVPKTKTDGNVALFIGNFYKYGKAESIYNVSGGAACNRLLINVQTKEIFWLDANWTLIKLSSDSEPFIPLSEKGVTSGVVPLDTDTKINDQYLHRIVLPLPPEETDPLQILPSVPEAAEGHSIQEMGLVMYNGKIVLKISDYVGPQLITSYYISEFPNSKEYGTYTTEGVIPSTQRIYVDYNAVPYIWTGTEFAMMCHPQPTLTSLGAAPESKITELKSKITDISTTVDNSWLYSGHIHVNHILDELYTPYDNIDEALEALEGFAEPYLYNGPNGTFIFTPSQKISFFTNINEETLNFTMKTYQLKNYLEVCEAVNYCPSGSEWETLKTVSVWEEITS